MRGSAYLLAGLGAGLLDRDVPVGFSGGNSPGLVLAGLAGDGFRPGFGRRLDGLAQAFGDAGDPVGLCMQQFRAGHLGHRH